MGVQKIKKLLLLMMVVGLTVGVLAGCANPKDTTEEFLTAIQKGDVEKLVPLLKVTKSLIN